MSTYILIVENEPDIVDVVSRFLIHEGFAADYALTCAEARIQFARRRPDIILIDWHLPDQDGDEWIEDLRADSTTSDIPIIMMTGGYPTPALLAQLRNAQIPLLIKPFPLHELAAMLADLTAPRERAVGAV